MNGGQGVQSRKKQPRGTVGVWGEVVGSRRREMRVNRLLKHTGSCRCSCWTGAMAVSDSGPATDHCDKGTLISPYHIPIIRGSRKWAHTDGSLRREINLDVFVFFLLFWMFCLTSLHLKLLLWYRREKICLMISSQRVVTEAHSLEHWAFALRRSTLLEGRAKSSLRAGKRRALGWKDERRERPLVESRSLSNLPGNRLSCSALNQWLFSFR